MFRIYLTEQRSGYINVLANSPEEAVEKVKADWEVSRLSFNINNESIRIHKVHEPQSIQEIDPDESLLEDPVSQEVIDTYDEEKSSEQPL